MSPRDARNGRFVESSPQMQNYKFLNLILLCNVFFAIICIPTAGKLIDFIGIPLSISIYYFPFVYIFGDIFRRSMVMR